MDLQLYMYYGGHPDFLKMQLGKKLKQTALMKQSIFMLAKFKFNEIILLIT